MIGRAAAGAARERRPVISIRERERSVHSWPIFIVGMAFLVLWRLGDLSAFGILGLGMVALAAWLRLRRPSGGGTARAPRPRAATNRSGRGDRQYVARHDTTPRFDVDELARRLGTTTDDLRSARARYARYSIPKRAGGQREILAPDAPTKALQRRILHRLLARIPIHGACHGFERGRSIVSNAGPHAGRAVVLRLDVRDFFAATATRRVRRLYRVIGWDREAARILTRLTTFEGGLPQGAPTSPRLANLVNVRLDARLAGLAGARDATYTRYADDLTFSFAEDRPAGIHDVIRATKRFLRQDGYTLHEGRKLRIRRRHERQLVTGLVVNARPALPRARRRWLRAVEHHLRVGRPATLTADQLTGWRAFEIMVEARVGRQGVAEAEG
jgi:RNA-directed DNA polymerase